MSTSHPLLAILALIPLGGSASAAQMWVNDLRLSAGIGVSPDSASEDYTGKGAPNADPDGTYTYDSLDHSSAGELSVGYYGGRIWRNGGFVWGAGLQYIGASYRAPLSTSSNNGSFTSNGTDVNLNDVGPFVQAGWGYAFDHWDHMEFTGFLSAGSASGGWVDDATPTTINHGSGSYIQAGVRLGFYWVLARHLLLGVQGELSSMVSDISVDNPNGSHSDVSIYSDGGALQGVIGVHF